MKKIAILLFTILALLLLFTYDKETLEVEHTNAAESPKKTYINTPMNTYKEHIEVQNIVNTIQTSGSNLNSHMNAIVNSKQAVEKANSQMKANDKALEAFSK